MLVLIKRRFQQFFQNKILIDLLFTLGAYKHADGKKIDGRRIVVDVERGRTVKSWRPRRLGMYR